MRIAASGGFYNASPLTSAWYFFKVEGKNFFMALFIHSKLMLTVSYT